MTKVKDAITRENKIEEIFRSEELIDDWMIKISYSIENYPDPWIDSLRKNFSSFLVYVQGIQEKYIEEIKPTLK